MTTLVPVASSGDSPERPEPTLSECVSPFCGWFAAIRNRSRNTVLAYSRDLQAFAAFTDQHGARYPRQVTFQHLEAYMAWQRHHRRLRASSVNRHRQAVAQLFKFLRRQGVVTSNPVEDVFSLKEPARLPKYLTIPEQERLLEHLAASESLEGRRNYAVVAVALFCGLRVEELATVKLTDLDLETGTLRLIGKGDKQREAVVIPRLRAILTDYLRDVRPKLIAQPIQGSLSRRGAERQWSIRLKIGGQRRTLSTGATTKDEAKRVVAERLKELRATSRECVVGTVQRKRGRRVWEGCIWSGGQRTTSSSGTADREQALTLLRQRVAAARAAQPGVPVNGYLHRGHGGSGVWYGRYEVAGRVHRFSTGTTDETEARAILADRVRDLTLTQESPFLFPSARRRSGYVRAKTGQPLLTRSIHAMVRRKVSGIVGRPVSPHQLRHSFATRLVENDAPLLLVMEAMGHSNPETTAIYTHLSTKKKRTDIAKYLEGRGSS
jgi:site-specific recombinase XerD